MNLLAIARKANVKVGWINKGTHGDYDTETGLIRLNIETMVVEIFLHEVIHSSHPLLNTGSEDDEDTAGRLTERVWKSLTTREIRILAKRLLTGYNGQTKDSKSGARSVHKKIRGR